MAHLIYKKDLTRRVADSSGLALNTSRETVNGFVEEIAEVLETGSEVRIRGFGRLYWEPSGEGRVLYKPSPALRARRNSNFRSSPGLNASAPPGPPPHDPPPPPPPPPPVTKTELVRRIADSSGLTIAEARRGVDGVVKEITEAIGSGHRVQLRGFGTFEPD